MSYTPTVWTAGDTVTSAKLNKMEQGIAAGGTSGGVLTVNINSNGTFDKTWKEIADAFESGLLIQVKRLEGPLTVLTGFVGTTGIIDNQYAVGFYDIFNDSISLSSATTDSENGYPVVQQDTGSDQDIQL